MEVEGSEVLVAGLEKPSVASSSSPSLVASLLIWLSLWSVRLGAPTPCRFINAASLAFYDVLHFMIVPSFLFATADDCPAGSALPLFWPRCPSSPSCEAE